MWGDARQPRDRRGDRFTPYSPYCDGSPSYYAPTMPPLPQMYGALDVRAFRPVAPTYGAFRPDDFLRLMSPPVYAQSGADSSDPDPNGGYYPQVREPRATTLSHAELCQQMAREFNESNRNTHVTAIQQDAKGQLWHVAMHQCASQMLWSEMRKSETPPRFLFKWNAKDRQHECHVTLDGYKWEL